MKKLEDRIITMSCGIGTRYGEADYALQQAKKNKRKARYNIVACRNTCKDLRRELPRTSLERAATYERLRETVPVDKRNELDNLVLYDGATGMLNRTGFVIKRKQLEQQGIKHGYYVMFDLDDMKKWNDTVGRHVVDNYIQIIGKVIAGNVRHKELYGYRRSKNAPDLVVHRINEAAGDEFLVYIPAFHSKENLKRVRDIAKRIIDSVYDAQIDHSLFGVKPERF